jgi:xylulokinase
MSPDDPLLLGIDIGTSGLKVVILDLAGRVIGQALREYAPDTPQPGFAEQEPELWVQAAVAATQDALAAAAKSPAGVDAAGRVAAIGFSGQMHSAVFVDRHGQPVRPAILWLDTRTGPLVQALRQQFGVARLAEWTGNPVMTGVTLTSLLWVKEHEPEPWAEVAHVMLAKDYVRFRLTGEIDTDYSDASATAMLDVGRRAWSDDLLQAVGIPRRILPALSGSDQPVGRLQADFAGALGLRAGLPVVCGAGDQEAQAVGNAIIRPGLLSSTIGTGGQLFTPIDAYRYDPSVRLHTFCHALPGLWHWMAATLTAGMSLRWLRDQALDGCHSYDELAGGAREVAPGAEGLLFLPYLAGERTPHLDPLAHGVFYGLTLRHTWRHMARAVMEGVVFSLLDGLQLMQQMGGLIQQAVASGGGARHPLWLQLQADIFGVDILRTESQEAAAVGAALLAGIGAGLFADAATACARAVRWSAETVHPRPEYVERYKLLGQRYRALYPALAVRFHEDFGRGKIAH